MEKFTTVNEVVKEITRMHKMLPNRPEIEEVEAAKMVINNMDREEMSKLEAINKQVKGKVIPEELFFVYVELQKVLVNYQSKEQKREGVKLLDLENAHKVFDELIQRASQCIAPGNDGMKMDLGVASSSSSSSSYYLEKKEGLKKENEIFSMDDSYVGKSISGLNLDGIGSSFGVAPQIVDSTIKTSAVISAEKMSMIKLASLIEVSAKKGTAEINLSGKLSDQVDWLPDSLGKLSSLITLDLSENRIAVLPNTIGWLSSLSKLDLHANKIHELPESIGGLSHLVFLDLRGNNLNKLPPSIGELICLEELDMSSSGLSSLPDTIGSLVNLKKLILETNSLDELPHTIGQCSSLQELRVDYNRIKALPEAVGKIESLEILSVRYNNVRMLPTTMSSLKKLRELNVSFNELEAIPESLCFATTLVRLDVSNNFADLRSLPRSIGNLGMLEYLDISNNQIRVLPDSFGSLSHLTVLLVDQTPLEVPPRETAEKGAKEVVQYMAELVAHRQAQPTEQQSTWMCCFSPTKPRKRSGVDRSNT